MASNRIIQNGDLVMIDIGGQDENGYFFDVARTIVAGEGTQHKKEIVKLARDTTDYASRIAKSGIRNQEWLNQTGEFVKNQIHSGKYTIPLPEPIMFMAHSMGLDMESLWLDASSNTELKEGMVFSVEPWIHVPGLGAARFEDTVVVTKKGGEVLNKYRYTL
jgi:Xaa-Pro aminopeptidase